MALVVLVGVAVIVLGIYSMVHNQKMNKLEVMQARVQSCEPSNAEFMGEVVSCYDIGLEIYFRGEIMCKTIKEGEPYEVGSYINFYYDEKSGKMTQEKYVNSSDSKGPWMIVGFGALIVFLGVALSLMQKSDVYATVIGNIFAYGIAILFSVIGFFLSFVKPRQQKQDMSNCHEVPGTLVDYVEESNSDNTGEIYTPIYAYYQNGEEKRIRGAVAGDAAKYRQIGRKVTIIVNDVTKKAYCLEDRKESTKMGFLFFLVGIAMCGYLLYRDFLG